MIIGSGMIANYFKKFKINEDVLIFASGVSNSKETDELEFEREFKLIKKYENLDKVFVYFSTCSVFDDSLRETSYVKHKLKIENYIEKKIKRFIIFRVPTVIGKTNNPNTLFNSFITKIKNNQPIKVQLKTRRYLIDLQTLAEIVIYTVNVNKYHNRVINIGLRKSISIKEIIKVLEKKLKIKAFIELKNEGNEFTFSNNDFYEIIDEMNIELEPNYYKKILRRYCN